LHARRDGERRRRSLNITTPTNKEKDAKVTIKIDGHQYQDIIIPPNSKDTEKRDAIIKQIKKEIDNKTSPTFNVSASGDTGINFKNLTKGTKVTFGPGTSGEAKDEEVAFNQPAGGLIEFGSAAFASLDSNGDPSTFTAGVITDVGELAFTIPATELSALDGTTIAGALYADLVPEASTHGFTIANIGDSLEFTFDPAHTLGEGGIVFGTTALTDGLTGSISAGVPEPSTWALLTTGFAGLARILGLSATSAYADGRRSALRVWKGI
jgi:hypothetical protein